MLFGACSLTVLKTQMQMQTWLFNILRCFCMNVGSSLRTRREKVSYHASPAKEYSLAVGFGFSGKRKAPGLGCVSSEPSVSLLAVIADDLNGNRTKVFQQVGSYRLILLRPIKPAGHFRLHTAGPPFGRPRSLQRGCACELQIAQRDPRRCPPGAV